MSNILNNKEFEQDIRQAATIVSDILLELKELVKPGVSLDALDEIAARRIIEAGAISANKGYKPQWAQNPYPATICACVDFEIAHCPPRGRMLKEGSIVTLDMGLKYKSAFADAATTISVGAVDNRKQRAMRYGLRALREGEKVVKAGVPIKEIAKAIEIYSNRMGYQVIRDYGGHHIGKEMHEEPSISHNYYPDDPDVLLEEGKVICLEPMLSPGVGRMGIFKDDGWTSFCLDGQPCVMFENMLLIKKNGCEVLTHHLK